MELTNDCDFVLPSIPVPTKGKPTPTTANSIEHYEKAAQL